MSEVTIQFSATNSIISRVIRWQSRSWASHVDILFPNGWPTFRADVRRFAGKNEKEFLDKAISRKYPVSMERIEKGPVLIGAISEGVRIHDFWKYSAIRRYSATGLTARRVRLLQGFLLRQLGKPYWWRGVFDWGLDIGDWRQDESWFCSDLIAAGFDAGRLPLLNPLVPCPRVTPGDLEFSPCLDLLPRYPQGIKKPICYTESK